MHKSRLLDQWNQTAHILQAIHCMFKGKGERVRKVEEFIPESLRPKRSRGDVLRGDISDLQAFVGGAVAGEGGKAHRERKALKAKRRAARRAKQQAERTHHARFSEN